MKTAAYTQIQNNFEFKTSSPKNRFVIVFNIQNLIVKDHQDFFSPSPTITAMGKTAVVEMTVAGCGAWGKSASAGPRHSSSGRSKGGGNQIQSWPDSPGSPKMRGTVQLPQFVPRRHDLHGNRHPDPSPFFPLHLALPTTCLPGLLLPHAMLPGVST